MEHKSAPKLSEDQRKSIELLIEKSLEKMRKIHRNDICELKALMNPHVAVEKVMRLFCYIFFADRDPKIMLKNASWDLEKRILMANSFIKDLETSIMTLAQAPIIGSCRYQEIIDWISKEEQNNILNQEMLSQRGLVAAIIGGIVEICLQIHEEHFTVV